MAEVSGAPAPSEADIWNSLDQPSDGWVEHEAPVGGDGLHVRGPNVWMRGCEGGV